jgi:hypothetical protein
MRVLRSSPSARLPALAYGVPRHNTCLLVETSSNGSWRTLPIPIILHVISDVIVQTYASSEYHRASDGERKVI